jgi:hypothetical protein
MPTTSLLIISIISGAFDAHSGGWSSWFNDDPAFGDLPE